MTDLSRRTFLRATTASTAATALASQSTNTVAMAEVSAPPALHFASQWHRLPDRVWLGPEYWSNPLQDWRIAGGRIECIHAAANRNVHLLTFQPILGKTHFTMSVCIGRVEGGKLADGKGSAGFRFGIRGPLQEYRNSAIYGQGIDAGFSADGRLFIGSPSKGVPVDLACQSVDLHLAVHDGITLTALSQGRELAKAEAPLPPNVGQGNVALVANFGTPAAGPAGKGKNKAAAPSPGFGQFWFSDWKITGASQQLAQQQVFGPILFSQYTLSQRTLKLTAQMPPLGGLDSQTVRLQIQSRVSDAYETLADEKIHPESRTATFRIDDWNPARDVPYRLVYVQQYTDGTSDEFFWHGTFRRDPVDQPVLTVADVSCNIHEAFPNADYTDKVKQLNPDLIAFVGDQFYESTGGYGVQRSPLALAILDYLRKWYLHGWTWRDLTRDRPSISIPDDHDVYQGNIWGEGGAAQSTTQEAGGYNMPAAWVNVVHRTQTSHHPDPWDATPGKQGISVYSGPLVYGRISFAILADRQFKSAPEGKVPPTGGRGDHVTDPNFDPQTADLPGLQLLGPGQMRHLRTWVRDWHGAEMKAVLSQTIFTAMATTHGSPNGRLVADYDTNGWPQSERNAALREIRKAFAVHLAGDQHLPAVVHYGIDAHRDAGLAFAGPAVNTGYPRWFEPARPGENRTAGSPENTGDFRDSFGNPLTVLAFAHPQKQPRTTVLEKLHDKVSGIGLVRFDKPRRKITIECWPFLADPEQPGTQFPGWPITFDVLDNFGKKPTAQLPKLEISGADDAVIEVIDERTGELVYNLRLAGASWQPHVFAEGRYTVRVYHPESGRTQVRKGLVAKAGNTGTEKIPL